MYIIFRYSVEKWLQGSTLAQEEEHCCKLSVFIHLHQAQDWHNIQNDWLLYHLAWDQMNKSEIEIEREKIKTDKVKFWWCLSNLLSSADIWTQSGALWMTSPGLVLTRSWTGLHPWQLWTPTSLVATPKLTSCCSRHHRSLGLSSVVGAQGSLQVHQWSTSCLTPSSSWGVVILAWSSRSPGTAEGSWCSSSQGWSPGAPPPPQVRVEGWKLVEK